MKDKFGYILSVPLQRVSLTAIENETVSSGDTAISLHTPQLPPFWEGGVVLSQKSKCQVLPKFQFLKGEGYSWVVKSQSAKFRLNFDWEERDILGQPRTGCSWQNGQKILEA